jgi:hypothetical protein
VCPGFCRFLQYRTLASKRDDRPKSLRGGSISGHGFQWWKNIWAL